jgi:hypothetical protein
MNKNNLLQALLLAGAALLLAGAARAAVPLDNPVATTPVGQGLLGQTYANLDYSYIDLDDSSVHADKFSFGFNQPLHAGLDGIFTYDWMQTGKSSGTWVNVQDFTADLRAFSTSFVWGKPYVNAGIGYAWSRGAPAGHDDSFLWRVAAGAELRVTAATTVTPYVQYTDTPDLAGGGTWNYGAKANYWVNSEWAISAGIVSDQHQTISYTVGTNFRF